MLGSDQSPNMILGIVVVADRNVALDHYGRSVVGRDGVIVRMQILDISGHDRFVENTMMFY